MTADAAAVKALACVLINVLGGIWICVLLASSHEHLLTPPCKHKPNIN
jgi:hypothetical protein